LYRRLEEMGIGRGGKRTNDREAVDVFFFWAVSPPLVLHALYPFAMRYILCIAVLEP
jgi:hypothetical protein